MVILRRIFPKKSTCPKCGSTEWVAQSHKADVQYRTCAPCGGAYKVTIIATEQDDGGAWSRVVPA